MIKNLLLNIVVGFLPTTMFAQNSIPGYTINTNTEASTVATQYGNVAGYIDSNGNRVPQWPAFTTKKKATMIFDKECEVKYNFDAELQQIGTRKR